MALCTERRGEEAQGRDDAERRTEVLHRVERRDNLDVEVTLVSVQKICVVARDPLIGDYSAVPHGGVPAPTPSAREKYGLAPRRDVAVLARELPPALTAIGAATAHATVVRLTVVMHHVLEDEVAQAGLRLGRQLGGYNVVDPIRGERRVSLAQNDEDVRMR